MRRYVAFVALALLFASGESGRLLSCNHDCANKNLWIHQFADGEFACKKSNYYDCRFCVDLGHDGCNGGNTDECLTYSNAGGELDLKFADKTGGTCTSACGAGTPGVGKVCEATTSDATFGAMGLAGLSVKTCARATPVASTEPIE